MGDATLATDANGYLIQQSQTANADGSQTTDIKAYNANGSEAFENLKTVSADGSTTTIRYDDNGDGVFDRSQTTVQTTNASGVTTQTVSDYNDDGSLKDATKTTTNPSTQTVTTQVDQNGDGLWDQSEVYTVNADGSRTETVTETGNDGVSTTGICRGETRDLSRWRRSAGSASDTEPVVWASASTSPNAVAYRRDDRIIYGIIGTNNYPNRSTNCKPTEDFDLPPLAKRKDRDNSRFTRMSTAWGAKLRGAQ